MGLSASQARLLSITARISDNELHSQQIANSKVRLADKTQEASREYVQALDSQKLVFTTYDAKGNATQVNLTPALLYDYSTIKNQYGISNNVGQLLVSSEMAKTYQTSKTLLDFLKANGCDVVDNPDYAYQLNTIRGNNSYTLNDVKSYYSQVHSYVNLTAIDAALAKNPSDLTVSDASAVNNAINVWYDHMNKKDSQGNPTANNIKIHSFDGSLGEYINILEAFNLDFPNIDDPKYHAKSIEAIKTSEKFAEASASCYKTAIQSEYGSGCYEHVLASLLASPDDVINRDTLPIVDSSKYPKTYSTTTGRTISVSASKVNGSAIKSNGKVADMADVGYYLISNNIKVPNTTVNYATPITNTEAKKLLSYTKDGGSLKTYQEMIVDVLYAVQNKSTLGLDYNKHLKPFLEKFQENMSSITVTLNDAYNQDVANWQTALEIWRNEYTATQNKYLEHIAAVPDEQIPSTEDAKTQWYINLWHRLNGESKTNVNYDSTGSKESGQKWKVLENSLFKSQSWMQYALEQGLITLEQVQYSEDVDDATGLKTSKWESKEYATCVDIQFVDDETAIARAEAIYTRKLNEIEAQDKKFDNEIKKLDTEHTALQTEYESVKSVVDKNVERSFKAFS